MRRTRGQEIRRLQKKLIPVNIIVCIICVIASLSLYFMPIIKLDLGAIVGADAVKKIVTEVAIEKVNAYLNEAAGGEEGSPDGGKAPEETGDPENKETARASLKKADEEVSGGQLPEETTPSEGGNPAEDEKPAESGSENGSEASGGSDVSLKDILNEINVEELVTPIVNEIMDAIKADISVSARNSLKVMLATDKTETLLDELFFNSANGFIPQIQKTLVKGFGSAFKAAGQQLQAAVVSAVVMPAIKDNLPKEYADLVEEEELQATVKKFDEAKSAQDACDTIIDYIDSLAEKSDEIDELSPERKADIEKQITDYYNKTVEHTRDEEGNDNFSLEAMITVLASEALDGVGDGFNLGDLLAGNGGGSGSGSGGGSGGENPEPKPENPEEAKAMLAKVLLLRGISLAAGGVEGENPPAADENTPPVAEEGDGGQTDKKVDYYTSYQQMGEGLASKFMGDDLASTAKTKILEIVKDYEQALGMYGYICIGVAFFTGLWVILFLFSFFHMFAKNKRFMMWYVKLFCFTPCFIFFIIPLLVTPALSSWLPWLCNSIPALGGIVPADLYGTILDQVAKAIGGALSITLEPEQVAGVFNAIISAFKSMTWVSGACYLALWVISVCWAFPIKHKIRKLKKGY